MVRIFNEQKSLGFICADLRKSNALHIMTESEKTLQEIERV